MENPIGCDDLGNGFWGGVLSNRINYIGTTVLLEQYPGATSIEAVLENEKALQGSISSLWSRYYDEERALLSTLEGLREHTRRQECVLNSFLVTVRQHRNLFTPVARLPPEILSQIFVFNAQIRLEGWLEAAHTCSLVCKRWREIALDCAELWSQLNFENHYHPPRWLTKIVERARSVPLSFIGGSGVKTWSRDERMALVVNNMHRFKSIDLRVPAGNNDDVDSLFKIFNESTPMLQDLTVSTPFANSSFVLPQDFLGGCASNLRHIKLSTTVLVPWSSALFSNLTTLEVDGYRNPRDNLRLSSLEMLLAALTKMPGLELLTLRKSIPPPAHSPMRCPCVDLPNLKQLELTGLPNRCTDFLGKITINANATLLLNLDCFSTMKDGIYRFLETLKSHPWMTPAATEALDLTWKRDIKFDPWSVQQGLEITRPNTSIHLSFDHLPVWAWPLDAAQVCFSAFASPRLRSFRISDDTMRWDVNVWRNLARTAPGLQRLAVGDIIQTVELCKALYPSGLNLVPADCCFPALSYLELTARQNHMMLAPDGGVTQLSTVLAHILAARAAAGCSTPEVVFIVPPSEGSPEGWSDAFQEAVPGIVVREHQWW